MDNNGKISNFLVYSPQTREKGVWVKQDLIRTVILGLIFDSKQIKMLLIKNFLKSDYCFASMSQFYASDVVLHVPKFQDIPLSHNV